ncbi:hypothetical protein [Streptomyces albidoflavus]|uniref:hypothetical protein n=1 Tax=Streptomyces albidoflavus TaxID=1886 RepID=UPI0033C2FD15
MSTCRRSTACYAAGCRNEPCVKARYRYQVLLDLDHARGVRRWIDATQTRVWINRLLAHGWTRYQIAVASGIAADTVNRIAAGTPTITRTTATAIQSIRLSSPQRGMVPALGTVRRLRALAVIGWTNAGIAEASGVGAGTISLHSLGRADTIHADPARRIAGAYRRLVTQPGPSDIVRQRAAARGWHGPLAWEDIDDPACQPETDERPAGLGRPEQIDDERVQLLVRDGHSNTQIAVRLGCSKRAVERSRNRTKQKEAAA